jgi:hypothetical protein
LQRAQRIVQGLLQRIHGEAVVEVGLAVVAQDDAMVAQWDFWKWKTRKIFL